MNVFKKGNVFSVGGFDSVDAFSFFLLAAILPFIYHILPFELPTPVLGPIIAVSVVMTFFQRQVFFPKAESQTHNLNPATISPLGLLAVFVVAIGFASSLYGFSCLYSWADFKPKMIDEAEVAIILNERLESAKLQEQLSIFASAKEVEISTEEAAKIEKVSLEDLMNEVEQEAERKFELQKDQIKAEVIAEMKLELEKENLETQEFYKSRGISLISVGFSLLFFAVFLKRLRLLLRPEIKKAS